MSRIHFDQFYVWDNRKHDYCFWMALMCLCMDVSVCVFVSDWWKQIGLSGAIFNMLDYVSVMMIDNNYAMFACWLWDGIPF